MATSTPNYALVKPAYSDWADITVLNNNADIIDTQLFAKASKTSQIIAGLGLTGGGDISTSRTLNIVSANAGIVVNVDNIELKPATTSIIGGVKPDGTTTSVDVNGVISTVNRASTSTQIIAGSGLTGGGDISASRTLNIVSATDGITSNADNIQLNTIDNLTTASSTKPLSATQGKWLKDKKIEDKGLLGTIDLNTLVATSMGVWYQNINTNTSIERNYPSDGLQAGCLVVLKTGVSGNSCTQEYVTYNSNKKFRRTHGGDALTWTAWAECYDSNNPQPLSDVGGVVNTTQIIAGTGLVGGGDLTTSRTLNVASANDGIIANADNIQLDTQNTLTSTSTTKPLSANMGKILQDTKLNLTGGTLTGTLNGTTATFSGNVTAPNIITDTSVGTCTVLFSGTQQCGQNTWKDTGIDIPTTYSSVLIGVNIASSGLYDIESEFSRCTLTRGQTLVFTHQAENERVMVKILGNRLWTYTSGNVMTDNNLKTVVGITRR